MRWLLGTALIVLNLIAYQNCAGDFAAMKMGPSVDLGSQSEPTIAMGKSMYDTSCKSCHGPVESSQKIGTNAYAIVTAIQNVPTMQFLKLSSLEVQSIVMALTPPKDDTLPSTVQLKYTCTSPDERGTSNPAVRRFSKTEFLNTIRPLIGTTLADDSTIAEAIQEIPSDDVQTSVDEFSALHSSEYAAALTTIADRLVEIVNSDSARRSALFGTCANAATIADSCGTTFIKNFGAKAFRRPLTTDEEAKFNKVFLDAGKKLKGLSSVLFVMIQSPSLAFHIEIGENSQGNRTRLTDYEVANRISYLTTSSPPDAALLTAASRKGELQSLTEVKKHVTRLLSSQAASAKSRVAGFMKYYGGILEIEDPSPVLGKALGISTTGLGKEMMKELSEYNDHIFWSSGGDFKKLMTSRDSFPRSATLQKILGTSARVGSDNKPLQASQDHVGYLHRPAFLASAGPRTTPILRGAHIRNHVLCDAIPFPPTDEVDNVLEELGDIEQQTNRERVTQLTSLPACVGCHAQINPVGFTFEKFDQLGFSRNQETIYDDAGKTVRTWPIDTRVQQPRLEASESSGASVTDSLELANLIANGSKARSCFAQKTFEFFRARKTNASIDGCALRETEVLTHSGSLRDVVIESIANEDIFWRKSN